MKKVLYVACVLLFSMVSCSTKRHTIQVTDNKTEATDSLASVTDSIASVHNETDSLSLGAALQSRQTEQGQTIEVDTSRTVIVTEFGADGQPVRQTETRQNGIAKQSSWSSDQQLQIDVYLEQVMRLNEQYDEFLRQFNEYCRERSDEMARREEQREPASVPTFLKWTIAIEYLLFFGFVLFIAYHWIKGNRVYK